MLKNARFPFDFARDGLQHGAKVERTFRRYK